MWSFTTSFWCVSLNLLAKLLTHPSFGFHSLEADWTYVSQCFEWSNGATVRWMFCLCMHRRSVFGVVARFCRSSGSRLSQLEVACYCCSERDAKQINCFVVDLSFLITSWLSLIFQFDVSVCWSNLVSKACLLFFYECISFCLIYSLSLFNYSLLYHACYLINFCLLSFNSQWNVFFLSFVLFFVSHRYCLSIKMVSIVLDS